LDLYFEIFFKDLDKDLGTWCLNWDELFIVFMYQIYQTEGLILKSTDFGEADKYLFIFTEDFGLIKIVAQSLRNITSKLRYGLQEFSFAQLSIVRGRNVWRMTNTLCSDNLYFSLSNSKDKLVIISRVLNLLMQLLSGEEKNKKLYNVVKEAFLFLKKNSLIEIDLQSFENIVVLRILYCLGYFDKNKKINKEVPYSFFLNLTEWNGILLNKMREREIKHQVIFDINKSLKSSQLC